jgi:UDP-glucose:glycoprotein glucosyltransferase
MKSSGVLHAGFVLSLLASGARCAAPPVKVSLRTSWPSPPFLLELMCVSAHPLIPSLTLIYSETISIEEPDAFFPLLDILTNPDAFPGKEELSHEALEQRALRTALSAGYLSKPGSLEAVQAQLGLHSATPKIVALYQHYTDKAGTQNVSEETEKCGSWVDWYGGVICDVDELIHLTGTEELDPAEESSFS